MFCFTRTTLIQKLPPSETRKLASQHLPLRYRVLLREQQWKHAQSYGKLSSNTPAALTHPKVLQEEKE